jgi:hypothetical protein
MADLISKCHLTLHCFLRGAWGEVSQSGHFGTARYYNELLKRDLGISVGDNLILTHQ